MPNGAEAELRRTAQLHLEDDGEIAIGAYHRSKRRAIPTSLDLFPNQRVSRFAQEEGADDEGKGSDDDG